MSKMIKKEHWITKKDVTQDMREDIVLYWRVSKDNGSKHIATKFGVTVSMVNAIIDNHLKNRTFANAE